MHEVIHLIHRTVQIDFRKDQNERFVKCDEFQPMCDDFANFYKQFSMCYTECTN